MIPRGRLFRNLKHDAKDILRFLSLTVVVPMIVIPAIAQNSAGDLGVMTDNVNEGTDFLQVLSATNATEFLLGVGQIVTPVQGTNPPEPMQSVAAQILLARPTLVSLQEVDQWYLGTFNPLTQACGPMSLEYDMLQELTDACGRVGPTKGLGWAFYLCAGGYLTATLMTTQLPETKGKRLE